MNPYTTIKFDIPLGIEPRATNINLGVYDVLGREVVALINEPLKPRSYEIQFDASNLPSGIYLYKLVAGGFIHTKRMMLLKRP